MLKCLKCPAYSGTSNIVTQNLISNTQTYKIRKKEKQNKFNLTQFDKLDRFYFNLFSTCSPIEARLMITEHLLEFIIINKKTTNRLQVLL